MAKKKKQEKMKRENSSPNSDKEQTTKGNNINGRNEDNTHSKSKKHLNPTGGNSLTVVLTVAVVIGAVAFYAYLYHPEEVSIYFEDLKKILDETFHSKVIKFVISLIYGESSAIDNTEPVDDVKTPQERNDGPVRNDVPSNLENDGKRQSGSKADYVKLNITSEEDYEIRASLDKADESLLKKQYEKALHSFDKILSDYPVSPRARFGKARALSRLAEEQKSNMLLERAIDQYLSVFDAYNVPKVLFLKAATVCAELQLFRGWGGKAVKTLQKVLKVYPHELDVMNAVGVKFLSIGRVEEARAYFSQVLAINENNGFAQAHLGFILKTNDRKYTEAIPYLQLGIASNEPGVIDGRFYFQLGDALFRVGREEESYDTYRQGAERGLFISQWQRSLYNVDGLKSDGWRTVEQTGNAEFLKLLENNWEVIRDEGLANLDPEKGVFKPESEDLREMGDWKQFTLYQQGRQYAENCKRAPKTCKLLEGFTAATGCKRGQIKFSVMQPGVHVWPHCGPTNCRIRAHLGLVIPEGPRIRVINETRTWKLGKFIVFDDSFEHEVWHDGDSVRLVLILDMWHPGLTAHQKATLSPI